MRLLALLAVALVLATGAVTSYLLYRQLETKIVALSAQPVLTPAPHGQCGSVQFEVEARTLARWQFAVQEGQTLSGEMAVQGEEALDVGFRVWAPQNRLVVLDPQRRHVQQFAIARTIRGAYTFEFDNRHSTFTAKQVALSLCVR